MQVNWACNLVASLALRNPGGYSSGGLTRIRKFTHQSVFSNSIKNFYIEAYESAHNSWLEAMRFELMALEEALLSRIDLSIWSKHEQREHHSDT